MSSSNGLFLPQTMDSEAVIEAAREFSAADSPRHVNEAGKINAHGPVLPPDFAGSPPLTPQARTQWREARHVFLRGLRLRRETHEAGNRTPR